VFAKCLTNPLGFAFFLMGMPYSMQTESMSNEQVRPTFVNEASLLRVVARSIHQTSGKFDVRYSTRSGCRLCLPPGPPEEGESSSFSLDREQHTLP
jgi:hypothetical protein